MEGQSNAVRRRASNGQDILAHCLDLDGGVGRHAMSTPRIRTARRNHPAAAQPRGGLSQSFKTRRIPAVVIGQEKRQTDRGPTRCPCRQARLHAQMFPWRRGFSDAVAVSRRFEHGPINHQYIRRRQKPPA